MKSPAFVDDCPYCQRHDDGYGCAFHEHRYAHDHGECEKDPKLCYFCGPFPFSAMSQVESIRT